MFRLTEPSSGQIQNKVKVHSASSYTMGSHTVYRSYRHLFAVQTFTLIDNV